MSKAKKIMVLDVEGMSTARPYNIGYLIADKHGNIFDNRSMAILPCVWENLQNCLQAKEMTHRNIQEILKDIDNSDNRKYRYNSIEEAKNDILNTIVENNVTEIWAYNCTFDKSSLKRLFEEDFEKLNENVTFHDIIPAIVYAKLLTKKYVDFCNRNSFITQKGNVMTKAEIVYRYLTNDLEFEEEHTGLNDCKIEYEILLAALKTKKKIVNTNTPAWRTFRQFCKEKEIETVIPLVPIY